MLSERGGRRVRITGAVCADVSAIEFAQSADPVVACVAVR